METIVVIVGLGGIGYRHFQSLIDEEKHKIKLFCIDVNADALDRAKSYERDNANIHLTVYYGRSIGEITENIDIAIIATSSMVRRKVFEELVNHVDCRFILFEKFLFPCEEDYESVSGLLHEKGITAYVNCCGRLSPGYIELKKELGKVEHLDVIVTGSNWGIGCNGIHVVDEMGFFLSTYNDLIVDELLLTDVVQSKREGYIDFNGTLMCRIDEKANIILESFDVEGIPFSYRVFANDRVYTFYPGDQIMYATIDGKTSQKPFLITLQSRLTAGVVDGLIENGECSLTRFENTVQWHLALLAAFNRKYNEILGTMGKICPVT